MFDKFRRLLWYLKHPGLYPHFINIVVKKRYPSGSILDDTRQEALQWCAELAVDTSTALEQLTGRPAPRPVSRLFSEYFESAENIARKCPAKMGGPGDLDLLYWSAEHLTASRVIETGVAYGWSSLAILLSLHKHKDAKLLSTDMPYPLRNNDKYVGCVVPEEFGSIWRILRNADRQALPRALKIQNTIDMCHYDSDKSYMGRAWAYQILWEALRPGGFFISDDIGDNVAFRDMSKKVECNPIVVSKGGRYIGVMIKPFGGNHIQNKQRAT
jgi:predicted O-methyltransferase YrrM